MDESERLNIEFAGSGNRFSLEINGKRMELARAGIVALHEFLRVNVPLVLSAQAACVTCELELSDIGPPIPG